MALVTEIEVVKVSKESLKGDRGVYRMQWESNGRLYRLLKFKSCVSESKDGGDGNVREEIYTE